MESGGRPQDKGYLVQECGAGQVTLRRSGAELYFAAPPLLKSGQMDAASLDQAITGLLVQPGQVIASNWVDNGPGWPGILLNSAREVLDLRPDFAAVDRLNMGVICACGEGGPADFEVRTFAPGHDVNEEPVTGSLSAGLPQRLHQPGIVGADYTVQQGTVLGPGSHLTISLNTDTVWVGGISRALIRGHVTLGQEAARDPSENVAEQHAE